MRSYILLFISILFFSFNCNAQCTIAGTVNSSTLSCATLSANNCRTLYIGDGSTTTSLVMNANLDLSCLGAIQFVVRNNAYIDFSFNNYNLQLAPDSSIVVEAGGNLGAGSNCSASDLIKIGNLKVASCNGGGGAETSFPILVSNGGFNVIGASSTSICGFGTSTITATIIPAPVVGTTYRIYDSQSGGTLLSTINSTTSPYTATYITSSLSSTTSFYVEATAGTVTTSRKEVVVTVNTVPTITGTIPLSRCSTGTVTLGATSSAGTINWHSESTGGTTLSTGNNYTTPSISTTTAYYVDATANGCTTAVRTAVVATVDPITVGGIISGGSTICSGSTSGVLTLSGHIGSVVKWQSSVSPFSTWTDISNASTTYISGILTQTTQFRAVVQSGNCTSANSSTTTVTVNALPVITSQPVNQLDCEGSSVKFKVVATGSGALTYVWQRKKPSEASFTAISPEANVTYPSVGEIRIANVGSADSPHGTQYQVIVSDAATCSVTSNIVTLSVNEITGVSVGTNVTQCYGTNYSYTVTVSPSSLSNVVSYQWKSSVTSGVWNDVVDGSHFSGAKAATLNIINGTPTESAEYRVFVEFNNSTTTCNVASYNQTRKIIFLPQLITPATTITLPDCKTSTGTITVAVQSASDEYSFDGGSTYQSSNIKSGLIHGSYNVIIRNVTGCTSSATTCILKPSITTVWNGNSWSQSAPTKEDTVFFSGDYSSTGDLSACTCQVNSGNVVFKSGNTLSVTNEVTVTAGGVLTFENNASLVQINDTAVNSGEIIYYRETPPVRKFDFTYWSSPVTGFTLGALSPNTLSDKYFSYNSGTGAWNNESSTKVMEPGVGYIVRAPQNYSINTPAPYLATFVGVPNNGNFQYAAILAGKYYVIGNPYPSALNAVQFLQANSSVLNGTIYFWTHNTAVTNNNYSNNDYASYNLTGSVGTGTPATSGGLAPLGNIAAGQGFFVSAKASGNVIFNNSMRVVNNNNQFFKTINSTDTSTSEELERHRVWLSVSNNEGATNEILVGYIEGATNEYDSRYDGEVMETPEPRVISLYTLLDAKKLVIQGRSLPFSDTDTVSLGYSTTIDGQFSIDLEKFDGLFDNQSIYLLDNVTGDYHDLKSGGYTFTTKIGTFNNRFELHYSVPDKTSLGTDNNLTSSDVNKIVIYTNPKNEIVVDTKEVIMSSVKLFDIQGKLLLEKNNINNNQTSISVDLPNQILLVQITSQDNKVVTKKFISRKVSSKSDKKDNISKTQLAEDE